MPRISAIRATPVKSLGLASLECAHITHRGIVEDRRFLLMDSQGRSRYSASDGQTDPGIGGIFR